MKYYIKTYGCAANVADSERIAGYYKHRGWIKARSPKGADEIVIVTCMIRQSAEDRIVGFVRNLGVEKNKGKKIKVIVTGCMTGMATRDKTGKLLRALKKRMPYVDEFLPIEDIGFTSPQIRSDKTHALVLISNGCNNYCSFCVVPYARGKEVSRPFDDIVNECKEAVATGHTHITLLGQNVNSYGADLVKEGDRADKKHITFVKHLGRMRIPTLFPHLLDEIASIKEIECIDFLSSNPWDFSDELIDTIAAHKNISRQIHLPVQSGSDSMLKRMNRWYTAEEYIDLIKKIRHKIPQVEFSTDIIVGFPGETEREFQETVELCKKVCFFKAYIAMYSDRPMTQAHKTMVDALPYLEKKKRWGILENLINIPTLKANRMKNKEKMKE
jgi:tRNA-2-methylthio-N6-dimethylallyladenosine synthase